MQIKKRTAQRSPLQAVDKTKRNTNIRGLEGVSPSIRFAKSRDMCLTFCTLRDALPAGSGSEQSPCDELPLFISCGIYANLRPDPGGVHEGDVRLLCSLWSPLCASLLTYVNKLKRK